MDIWKLLDPKTWAGASVGLANPQANCDHRYCYRDIHCTKCGKPYSGEGEPEFTPHIIRNGKPVPAHDENGVLVPDDLETFIMENFEKKDNPLICPYCGGDKFREGPSGGMSTNILCANPDCRHWFNYHGGILPMDDLKRVEPTEAEKEAEKRKHDKAKDEAFATRIRQGYDFFKQYGSTTVMRLAQQERGFTYPRHEQIDQLCGFMDAMCDAIRTLQDHAFGGKVPLYEHGSNVPVGHVDKIVHPAYGPGSITDAATYAESNFEGDELYGLDKVTRVWGGAWVRINTRVMVKARHRPATVIAHDDAWNNEVRYDDGSTEWAGRAPALEKADGSGPLDDDDFTTTKGAEKFADDYMRALQKTRHMVRDLKSAAILTMFANFCAFLDGYDGHPADGFKAWAERRGTPLDKDGEKIFMNTYHKEE